MKGMTYKSKTVEFCDKIGINGNIKSLPLHQLATCESAAYVNSNYGHNDGSHGNRGGNDDNCDDEDNYSHG